jgi:beta-galactosidase
VVGAGSATYVSTEPDDAGLAAVLANVLARAGVEPDAPGAGDGLEAVRRYAGEGSYLFLINHSDRPRETSAVGTDILSGTAYDGPLTMEPGDMLVLREASASRPN